MALKKKYEQVHEQYIRDVRPWYVRTIDAVRQPSTAAAVYMGAAFLVYQEPLTALFADLVFVLGFIYFIWLLRSPFELPFKLPASAKQPDPNNRRPGTTKPGPAEGILYLGTSDEGGEMWFTNTDIRTHILYLGTTGSGKTVGLTSIASNALCWGSGFIYIDGKADTDLWSSMSALARRFGRDDDLVVMNYMTGNKDGQSPSNSLNPFSSGSASYLTNMLVSLMPDAEGDNAMWKERAVSLVGALMPVLTWKRENQNMPLNVSTIRKSLGFQEVIKLSRDAAVPENLRAGLQSYLTELPGYVAAGYDDQGNEKPLPPDMPPMDSNVPRQQHGYLSMQFTRSLQSLGDEYGYIFDTEAADIDMLDIVLNRRILIVLIPALEKSSDETSNLGKIIAANLKGMMGATLGSTVEGESAVAIENKPTHCATPFVAIFDEVGYYTAQGMAVMAAQARSLGFSLVFAAQDLPALEKRVKEEARSITANCNIKIFGKLEDPTSTKEFFEKTVGETLVSETSGYSSEKSSSGTNYSDSGQTSLQVRSRASYDGLRAFKEGQAVVTFGDRVVDSSIFYANPGMAKAMRVQRFIQLLPPEKADVAEGQGIEAILKKWRTKGWRAAAEGETPDKSPELKKMIKGFATAKKADRGLVECGATAIAFLAGPEPEDNKTSTEDDTSPHTPDKPKPELVAATGAVAPPDTSGAAAAQPSWQDFMGGGESTPDPKPDVPPGAVDAEKLMRDIKEREAQAPLPSKVSDDAPLSWSSLMGAGGTDSAAQKTPEDTSSAPSTFKQDTSDPDKPLGWSDLMGGGDESDKT